MLFSALGQRIQPYDSLEWNRRADLTVIYGGGAVDDGAAVAVWRTSWPVFAAS